MKILVDSSVWGDFFNGYPSTEANALAGLIEEGEDICTCGVVVSEVFQGLRRKDETLNQIEGLFRELTFLEAVGFDIYLRSAEVYRLLRRRGITIRSTIDCLIAVLAETNGCYLLAKDKDMRAVVNSGILRLSSWPPSNTRR
jgi:predicted nucleic acid-binding protein